MSYPLSGAGLGDAAAQRVQLLQDAYARGDTSYLLAWINDVPAHPTASVTLARQLLAKLQVPHVSSGAITFAPSVAAPAPAPSLFTPQAPPPPSIAPDGSSVIPTVPDSAFSITAPAPAPIIDTSSTVPSAPSLASVAGGMSPALIGAAALLGLMLVSKRRRA